ncbi:MAG: ketopantoate reductase family protein, partial [Treponema sp.]|nr:ketopantoate reductase family protein [Treponema sp.]
EDNSKTERIEAICRLLKASNINYKVPEDIKLEQWKKYLLNVTFNTLSAICRSTYGGFRFPVMQNLARKVGAEVVCIANKLNIALTMDMLEYDIKLMCSHDPFGKTSMLQDMEAERKSENAWFCGTIVKLGKELSIATPTCELLEQLVEGTEKVRELKA